MTRNLTRGSGEVTTTAHVVDLHLHTTYSDGLLSPRALIELVAEAGLNFVALTDHDTTDGLDEALREAERYPELNIIPGVELSTEVPGGQIHILAYYVDQRNQVFQHSLAEFRKLRVDRGEKMVSKLAAHGVPVSFGRVLEIAGHGAIGRPHVARALVEEGYVANVQAAFDRFLAEGRPAYVERDKLTPEQAIRLSLENGALPVLAHPCYVPDLEAHLAVMKNAGLVGMEVHYGSYSDAVISELQKTAHRFDLIPCGGSDYHGTGRPGEIRPGDAGPPLATIERLAALQEVRFTRPPQAGGS